MKARFPGKCAACNGYIPKDTEIVYSDKKARHVECAEKESGPADPEQLAERLGFIEHAEAERINWTLRNLPKAADGTSTGRRESDAFGRNGVLWE